MILNDDGPLLTITDMSRMEDNSSTPFTFTVSLTELSAQTVSVHYASANGTATAGSDYTAINGTLTIPAGQLSDQISVNITGDTTVELDETFYVNLSSPVNATIADAQGVGTILNDDDAAAIPFIDITSAFGCAVSNNVISVDFSIPLAIDGTNNQNVVGFMWMTTNSVGDWRISFPASAAWFCTTNVYMYPACMNSIYVYGSNVYGIVTNDVVMVYGIPEGIGACGLLSLVMIARGRRVLRK